MRRRVLFIINSLAGGGAERVMETLLAHSAPWHGRYEIALALLDDEPRAYAVPEGITVHQFASRGSLARATFALRRLLSDWRPDVALSFLTRANVAAWLARRHAMPLVISERVNTSAHLSHGLAGQLSRRMVALAYPRADHLIAVSHGVADDLAANFGVDRGKVTVLSNPVDLASIEASAAAAPEIEIEGPYVVAAGRLVENKNFALLIDAFVDAQMPGKLVIIGEGPLRADLEQRARDRGAADRIVLAGFVANPFPILANADLFVLSSNAEGFPNALVEAMALGRPVIATNCASGPSEILADSRAADLDGLIFASHGTLVPTNDRSALAEALRALRDPALRARYGAAARRRAMAYSADAAAQRYWRVLEGAMMDGAQ